MVLRNLFEDENFSCAHPYADKQTRKRNSVYNTGFPRNKKYGLTRFEKQDKLKMCTVFTSFKTRNVVIPHAKSTIYETNRTFHVHLNRVYKNINLVQAHYFNFNIVSKVFSQKRFSDCTHFKYLG
jgi:hypothetical protein